MECKKIHSVNNIKVTWLEYYANRSYPIVIFVPLISEKTILVKKSKESLQVIRHTKHERIAQPRFFFEMALTGSRGWLLKGGNKPLRF